MVIYHSYVSLPEGICCLLANCKHILLVMTCIYNLLAVVRKYGSDTNTPMVMSYDWKPSIGIVIVSHQPLQIKFK